MTCLKTLHTDKRAVTSLHTHYLTSHIVNYIINISSPGKEFNFLDQPCRKMQDKYRATWGERKDLCSAFTERETVCQLITQMITWHNKSFFKISNFSLLVTSNVNCFLSHVILYSLPTTLWCLFLPHFTLYHHHHHHHRHSSSKYAIPPPLLFSLINAPLLPTCNVCISFDQCSRHISMYPGALQPSPPLWVSYLPVSAVDPQGASPRWDRRHSGLVGILITNEHRLSLPLMSERERVRTALVISQQKKPRQASLMRCTGPLADRNAVHSESREIQTDSRWWFKTGALLVPHGTLYLKGRLMDALSLGHFKCQ